MIKPQRIIAAQYVGDELGKVALYYSPTVEGDRTCATVGCGTKLSRYNLGTYCSRHEGKAAVKHANEVLARLIASKK